MVGATPDLESVHEVTPQIRFLMESVVLPLVLADESLFCDGPPRWQNQTPSAEAERRRSADVKRLRRFGKTISAAEKLAATLHKCRSGQRCGNGACVECTRAVQRWLVNQINRLIALYPQSSRVAKLLTVVPESGLADAGFLNRSSALELATSFQKQLKAAGHLTWCAAAIDVSLNDETARTGRIYWSVHFHGIARVCHTKAIVDAMAPAHRCDEIYRPVLFSQGAITIEALSYCLKHWFARRCVYWSHREGRTGWNWRYFSLRRQPAQRHVELLLWLGKTGLANRFLLIGLRPHIEDGKPVLRAKRRDV